VRVNLFVLEAGQRFMRISKIKHLDNIFVIVYHCVFIISQNTIDTELYRMF